MHLSQSAKAMLIHQYRAVLKRCWYLNHVVIMPSLLTGGAALAAQPPIVADGRTATQLSTSGNTTNITTQTVQGVNAYNSFSRFNVETGQTVNLHVPLAANNLLNLVHNERSEINGILNGYKDGRIGGNIFFLNPHGMTIGPSGIINVGSLTIQTPTQAFMDELVSPLGGISGLATQQVLDGLVPISESGTVIVKGKINVLHDVAMRIAGLTVTSSGIIRAGPQVQVAFGDITNATGIESGNAIETGADGSIRIVAAGDAAIAGQVKAEGADNRQGGTVEIRAGNDITLDAGALVSASGSGNHSSGGTVTVFAERNAYFQSGAAILAAAGQTGDGGFIEFSAKDTVTMTGGLLRAGAANGLAGLVLIDPATIDWTGSANDVFHSDGTNFALVADTSITLSDVVISTRKVATGDATRASIDAATSTGNSGSITLTAPSITLTGGTKLLAHVESGSSRTAGDITLTATDSAVTPALTSLDDTTTSITLNHAILKGKAISIKATSDDAFDYGGETADTILGFLDNLSLLADVTISRASATISLDGGSQIAAATTLDIAASATSDASMKVISTAFGFGYGDASSIAHVEILDADLTSGGAMTLNSQANTTVSVGVTVTNDGKTNPLLASANKYIDLAAGYATGKINAKVSLGDAATVATDGALTVSASGVKDSSISISAKSYDDGTAAGAVGISLFDADVSATLDGSVSKAASIIVDSALFTVNDSSSVSSGTGTGIIGGIVKTINPNNFLIDKLSGLAGKNTLSPKAGAAAEKLGLAAALGIVNQSNDVDAAIGDGALVTSNGALLIQAISVDPITYKVAASVDQAKINADGEKKAKKVALSAAVALIDLDNQANAQIGASANVKASGALTVHALADIPVPYAAWGDWSGLSGWTDYVSKVKDLLTDSTFSTITGWVQTFAESDKLSLAGSVNIFSLDNAAIAGIGNSARINEGLTIGGGNDVNVVAEESEGVILLSGVFGFNPMKLFTGTQSGNAGFGGTYLQYTLNGTADARIGSAATIKADDLIVAGLADRNSILIGESGGKAGTISFNGVFNWADITAETAAQIGAGSTTTARNVVVDADDDTDLINVAGGIAGSANVGIGVSVSLNEVNRDVVALIGNRTADLFGTAETASGGTLTASGDLLVDANATGLLGSFSLAASVPAPANEESGAKNSSKGKMGFGLSGDVSFNEIADRTAAIVADGVAVTAGSTDDGTTAAVSLSILKDVDGDSVNDLDYSLDLSHNLANGLTLAAADVSDMMAFAGAITVKTKASAGIAGSYTQNTLGKDTWAAFTGGSLLLANNGDLGLFSLNDGELLSIAVGGGGSSKIGIAGSGSYNQITSQSQAWLDGTAVGPAASRIDTPDVAIDAKDTSDLRAIAGAISIGGDVGFGASIAVSEITNTVKAYAEDTDITANNLAIQATNDSFILCVGVAGGFSANTGVGGAGAYNLIDNTTEAGLYKVNDTLAPTITLDGYLSLVAIDDALTNRGVSLSAVNPGMPDGLTNDEGEFNVLNDVPGGDDIFDGRGRSESADMLGDGPDLKIVAVVTAISGASDYAVGLNAAVNQITSTAETTLDGVAVTAGAASQLTATSGGQITAIGTGGAGSGTGALAANVAVNRIGNHTSINLINSASLDVTTGDLTLLALDQSKILAVSSGVAFSGSYAAAAAVAYNRIANDTLIYLSSANLDVDDGALSLQAQSSAQIQAITTGVSASGTGALSGAVALNTIGDFDNPDTSDTESGLQNYDGTGASTSDDDFDRQWTGVWTSASTLDASDNITFKGWNDADILSVTSGLGFSGTAAIGLSGTYNNIATRTFVDTTGGHAISSGGALLAEAEQDSRILAVGAGAAFSGTGALGVTVSLNWIANTLEVIGTNTALQADSSLTLLATDATDIMAINGALAGSGTAAAGGAASDNEVENIVRVKLSGGSATSDSNSVWLTAEKTGDLFAVAAAGSGAGAVNLSGSVARNIIGGETTAEVLLGADILADDNVRILADSANTIFSVAGGIGGSGAVALGGAVSLNDISDTVRAKADGTGTTVTAKANGSTMAVPDGTLLDSDGTKTMRGTAVVANDRLSIESIAANLSGSGAVALVGSYSSNILGGTTEAVVSSGAIINPDATGESLLQSALVGAYHWGYSSGWAGAAAGSGSVAIAGGVDDHDMTRTVRAKVDGATLYANDDLTIEAVNRTDAISHSIGGALSTIGINGAVSMMDDSALTETVATGTLNAGDQLLVAATRDEDIEAHSGSASISLVGVGASVANINLLGDTNITIGNSASLTGKGVSVTAQSVSDSDIAAYAGSIGIATGSGSDVRTTDKLDAAVTLGDSVTIQSSAPTVAGNTVSIAATVNPKAESAAYGGGVGAVAAYGSFVATVINPVAKLESGSGLTLTGYDVELRAAQCARDTGWNAEAKAYGGAGGLVGVAGAEAKIFLGVDSGTSVDDLTGIDEKDPTVKVALGSSNTLTAKHDLKITGYSGLKGSASANSFSLGLAAGGGNTAEVRARDKVLVSTGSGLDTTVANTLTIKAETIAALRTDAVAGAGSLVGASAALSDITRQGTAKVLIGAGATGRDLSAKHIDIDASNTVAYRNLADSLAASLVGGSGAEGNSTITSAAEITLGANLAMTGTTDVLMDATNTVNRTVSSGEDYSISAGAGGAIAGAGAASYNTISNDARITVNAGDQITTTEVVVDDPGIGMTAQNILNIHDITDLDAGGAIPVAVAGVEVHVDQNNAIITIGDADLSSAGEISLAASTRGIVNAEARAKTYGLAGGAGGWSFVSIDTDSEVNLLAGAHLFALDDIRLLAGDSNPVTFDIEAYADVRAWNWTAIPISGVDPSCSLDQTSKVNVAGTAEVLSVRDIYLDGAASRSIVSAYGATKDIYKEAIGAIFGDAAVDSFSSDTDETSDAGVTINGRVRSGLYNQQYLTIDSSGIITRQDPGVTINITPAKYMSIEIDKQIQALELLAAKYCDLPDVSASFRAQADLLRQKKTDAMYLGYKVPFIEVGPLVAAPGNVHINGNYLLGSGKIEAPGDARIEIANDSPYFLDIKGLSIPAEAGGQILFNDAPVSTNLAINERNEAGKVASFIDTNLLSSATSPTPAIVVTNSFDPNRPGMTADQKKLIPAEMWVNGDLSNHRGLLSLDSIGSIMVNANIEAATIQITTAGDFMKGFTFGFTHAGGNIEDILASLASTAEAAKTDTTANYYANAAPSGSIIAGNNVFISAERLNINGTIQSGLPIRGVDLDLDLADSSIIIDGVDTGRTVAAMEAAYSTALGLGLNPTGIFTLNAATSKTDPTTTPVQVCYNAKTDSLELYGVQVQGGYLELYGDIFSTGYGKLNVLDGYGRIAVTNDTPLALTLNRLDAGSGVEGKLKITDTSRKLYNGTIYTEPQFTALAGTKPKWSALTSLTTIYTHAGQDIQVVNNLTIDSTSKQPNHLVEMVAGSRATDFDTAAGRRYVWVTGQEIVYERIEKYQKASKTFFGADMGALGDWFAADPGTLVENNTYYLSSTPLPEGSTLLYQSIAGNPYYAYDYTQVITSAERQIGNDIYSEWCSDYDSFLGITWCAEKTYERKRIFQVGTKDYHTHSIKADYSIGITFTGFDTGAISVSSAGGISLNSSVNAGNGVVALNATGGSITAATDAAIIRGANAVLKSAGSIGTVIKPIPMDLRDTGWVYASAGGDIGLAEDVGDLRVITAASTSGNIALYAENNILEVSGSGISAVSGLPLAGIASLPVTAAITGKSITLEAHSGAIGSDSDIFEIDTNAAAGGRLAATAANEIHIQEISGDLNLFTVQAGTLSNPDDVEIRVPHGSLYDANPEEVEDTRTKDELLQLWKDSRLIGSEAEESLRLVTAAVYARYLREKGTLASDAGGVLFAFTSYERSALVAAGWTEARILEREAAMTDAYRQIAADGYAAATLSTAQLDLLGHSTGFSDLASGYQWTEAQLGLTLGAGLFKETPDTEVRIEDDNIIARNLTLAVSGQIGKTNGTIAITRGKSVNDMTDAEKLALASAERDDVTLTSTQVIIDQKEDVDFHATGGVDIAATGHIYLGSEYDINLVSVAGSTGNLRIKAAGIYDIATPGNTPTISGVGNILLEAAKHALGTVEAPIRFRQNTGGTLVARGDDGVYLRSIGSDMLVSEVFSRGAAVLKSSGDILSATVGSGIDLSASDITLIAGGDVGTTLDPFEVKLNGGVIDWNVTGDAWIYTPEASLTLTTSWSGGTTTLNAQSSIVLLEDEIIRAGNELVIWVGEFGIDGQGVFTMQENSELIVGNKIWTVAGTITMEKSTVGQPVPAPSPRMMFAPGPLPTWPLDTSDVPTPALKLQGVDVIVNDVQLVITGDMLVEAEHDFTINNHITVQNGNTRFNVGHSIFTAATIPGSSPAAAPEIDISGWLKINGVSGNADMGKMTIGGNLIVTLGGSFSGNGEITVGGNASFAVSDMVMNHDLDIDGNLVITSGGDLALHGTTTVGGTTTLTARDDLTTTGLLDGGGLITLVATTGSIALDDVVGDAGLTGTAAAENITLNGTLTLNGGNLALTAGWNLLMQEKVWVKAGNATLKSTTGDTTAAGDLAVSGNLKITAGDDIALHGTTTVGGTTTMTAGGDLATTGLLDGGGLITLAATDGSISLVEVVGDAGLTGTASRDITLNRTLTLNGGNLRLTAGRNLLMQEKVWVKAGYAALTSTAGDTTVNGDLAVASYLQMTAGGDIALHGTTTVGGFADALAHDTLSISGLLNATSWVKLIATTGDLTMTDEAVVRSNSGPITMTASQDVTLGSVQSPANAVVIAITATHGAIIDAGDSPANIIAPTGKVTLTAATGIGAQNGLETEIAELTATVTGKGNLNLAEANNLRLVSATTADGYINLHAGGTLQADLAITNDAGNDEEHDLFLSAAGNLIAGTLRGDHEMFAVAHGSLQATAAHLAGERIWLVAETGSIGSSSSFFTMDSAGALEAYAEQGLWLRETAGDLVANTLMTPGTLAFDLPNAGGAGRVIVGSLVAKTVDAAASIMDLEIDRLASAGTFTLGSLVPPNGQYNPPALTSFTRTITAADLGPMSVWMHAVGGRLTIHELAVEGEITLRADNIQLDLVEHQNPEAGDLTINVLGGSKDEADTLTIDRLASPGNVTFGQLHAADGFIHGEVEGILDIVDGFTSNRLRIDNLNVFVRIDAQDKTPRLGVFHLWTLDSTYRLRMNEFGIWTDLRALRADALFTLNDRFVNFDSVVEDGWDQQRQYEQLRQQPPWQSPPALTGLSSELLILPDGSALLPLSVRPAPFRFVPAAPGGSLLGSLALSADLPSGARLSLAGALALPAASATAEVGEPGTAAGPLFVLDGTDLRLAPGARLAPGTIYVLRIQVVGPDGAPLEYEVELPVAAAP